MIEEKRIARRFGGRIAIVSSDIDGLNFSFITDLSRDGAHIETEKVLAIGTTFQFVLSNKKIQTPVKSKVVWARDAFFHGGRSGLGVRFDGLESSSKMVRDDLLLFLMSTRYQAIWNAA